MDWGEAFSRATGAVLAAIIWSVVAFVLFSIGLALMASGFDAFETVWAKVIFGLLFVLAGWVFIYMGLLATAIKTITDAVTDHVEARLNPDWSGTSAPSPRATQPPAPRVTRPSRRPSATPPRQTARRPPAPSPATPVDEITVSSTGDMVGIAISMPDLWTVTPADGGSPSEGPVSIDNHLGRDDMTIYFYWNQDHEFAEPASFEFVVRGSANRIQNITVHAVE